RGETRRPSLAAERRDGRPHVSERGLEEAPDVDLALVPRGRLADVAAGNSQRRDASRIPVQAAAREQAGGQRQAEDRRKRRVTQLGLDLRGDGLDGVQVAGGVEPNQLVDQLALPIEDRE